jgi:hypothetical protein
VVAVEEFMKVQEQVPELVVLEVEALVVPLEVMVLLELQI